VTCRRPSVSDFLFTVLFSFQVFHRPAWSSCSRSVSFVHPLPRWPRYVPWFSSCPRQEVDPMRFENFSCRVFCFSRSSPTAIPRRSSFFPFLAQIVHPDSSLFKISSPFFGMMRLRFPPRRSIEISSPPPSQRPVLSHPPNVRLLLRQRARFAFSVAGFPPPAPLPCGGTSRESAWSFCSRGRPRGRTFCVRVQQFCCRFLLFGTAFYFSLSSSVVLLIVSPIFVKEREALNPGRNVLPPPFSPFFFLTIFLFLRWAPPRRTNTTTRADGLDDGISRWACSSPLTSLEKRVRVAQTPPFFSRFGGPVELTPSRSPVLRA